MLLFGYVILERKCLIIRMVSTLIEVCQFGTRGKKCVNCVLTFEKVSQLGPF